MKKSLLGLLFIVSQFAGATSILDTRLSLHVTPIVGGDVHEQYINVYGNGEVVGYQCERFYRPGPGATHPECAPERLDQLGQSELRKIDRLIARAKKAQTIYPDPFAIHCMAMPIEHLKYSVANGFVIYEGGQPCGNVTYKDGRAAAELVMRLNDYRAQLNELFDGSR